MTQNKKLYKKKEYMFGFSKKNNLKEHKEEKSLILINDFDEYAYLEVNSDVKMAIEKGEFVDAKDHLQLFGLDEIKRGSRKFHKDFLVFDEDKYKDLFEDVALAITKDEFKDGFNHFCLNGYQEIISYKRYWNTEEIEEKIQSIEVIVPVVNLNLDPTQLHIYNILSEYEINWMEYLDANNIDKTTSDPLLHYIKTWEKSLPIFPNLLDTALYMSLYSDMASNAINPLYHYLTSGREEGRQGLFNIESYLEEGSMVHNIKLDTLVVVNHESSATGAPLLGLNIAQSLSKEYNIIQIILKPSVLHTDFLKSCELMVSGMNDEVIMRKIMYWLQKKKNIISVICNSVETLPILKVASALNLPTLSLIHEFANYTRPIGKLSHSVFYADKIVVPANIIKESLYLELKETANIHNELNNFVVLPQGKLPYIPEGHGENISISSLKEKLNIARDTKVIIGAGFVQIRKGVDLFISMAKYIQKLYSGNCKFIWVGEGFDPINDLGYSVWLEKYIEASGLTENFTFLGHQKNLNNILAIADVFALTSRLDPFPNVVIDALASDVHVACFLESTGCADFLVKHRANSSVVDYLDTYQMAHSIIGYLRSSRKKTVGINKKIVYKSLNFPVYIKKLTTYIEESIHLNTRNQMIANELLANNEFYGDFFSFKKDRREGCHFYVNNTQKGIYLYNPKPGFSDKKWLSQQKNKTLSHVPLYEAFKEKKTLTHEFQVIPFETSETIDFFYAVHLHLFYIELGEEFASYFKSLPGKFDILITIIDKDDLNTVVDLFSVCGANEVKVKCVKNIGRDSGPLYFGMYDEIMNNSYSIIGHFHSKKSFDIHDGIGNRWRKYLTENLIGDKKTAKSVLSLFNDSHLGLVFPEDAHSVDIGENKEYLDSLCTMLEMNAIEETSLFPLGNMFWARISAIKDIFHLDKSKILKEEPLPYDGSYMHALERILPKVVEKNKYTYKTVYKKGTKW